MSSPLHMVLIVNNPVRDLGTAVLLAYGLCQKGTRCRLLPLATRSRELWALAPAAADLPAGTVLEREHVAIKSPNDGLPPYELERVLGKRLKRGLAANENLAWEDLED